ncbi:unnamed protein product [Caenorhabditis sp. 36 PRJEB53466]|nr:unnamed protein product [Caenorhabditis sp. 36 PRJEB53466]
MSKCKPDHRLYLLYVIDSIVRASKNQLKEKDVFGPRFIKHFDKFLEPLLRCEQKVRLKTVRTLNLWMCNNVFAGNKIEPYLEKCKNAGMIVGVEEVEKAVKGDQADMNLYNGEYRKKQKTTKTPPSSDNGLLGAGPSTSLLSLSHIPTFPLSEECVDETISEREMLELVQKCGIDRQGLLSKNKELLQKVLCFFSGTLKSKITEINLSRNEKDNHSGSSIQNVLTKDFEYSDDEEEKEKEKEQDEPKRPSHDEIFGLAQKILAVPAVLSQINEILNPRSTSSQPIPNQTSKCDPSSSTGSLSIGHAPTLFGLPSMPGFPALPNLSQLNAAQLLNVQNAQNLILQQRAAHFQALQSLPGPQQNLLMLGAPIINAFGIPTNVNPLLPPVDLQTASAKQQAVTVGEGAISEKQELNEDLSRYRSSKESRERRKMGLPSVKQGFTIIASRTLCLKKVPANVTENELKQSVESCGEASRIKIIGNRACAFITMETRKAANDVVQKLRELSIAKKKLKVYWARGPGTDSELFTDLWDSNRGIWEIPYSKLPNDLLAVCEGAVLDLESLPDEKRNLYKEDGERILSVPPPISSMQPLVPQPPVPQPPLGFHFPMLGQFPGHSNFSSIGAPKPNPPGVPPLLNLSIPPPPTTLGGYPPAPPPPGLGAPQNIPPPGFDPNKPPPTFQQTFNTSAPPPPFAHNGGASTMFGNNSVQPPAPFRGVRGNGVHIDSPRRGGSSFRPDGHERPRLMDQSEMWSRERDRDRDRLHGDRRRFEADYNRNGSRRRTSRWGDDEKRGGDGDNYSRRRLSEKALRRSPSRDNEQPTTKKTNADDETVSSTTLDELKPTGEGEVKREPFAKPEEHQRDQTDEVPMDVE